MSTSTAVPTEDPPAAADLVVPGVWPKRFREARGALAGLVGELDAGSMLATDAAGVLDELIAVERLVAGAKVLVAARAADAGLWRTAGARSAGEWLARRNGTSTAEADGTLDASKKIRGLAEVEASLRNGELSGPQASTVAEAAAANPLAQSDLLEVARTQDLRGLRTKAEEVKQQAVPDEQAQQERIHRRRSFRHWTRNGEFGFAGTLTADAGARFLAALQPFADAAFKTARKEGRHEPGHAYAADGLVAMAEAAAGGGEAVGNTKRSSVKTIVRLDADVLVQRFAGSGQTCEIDGLGPVPFPAAASLMDGSLWASVVTKGRDVYRVTHHGRAPTEHMRTALEWRDQTCCVEGCSNRVRLENDHVDPVANGGVTSVNNLERKCRHCHALKSNAGWTEAPGPAGEPRPLLPPETLYDTDPDPPDW